MIYSCTHMVTVGIKGLKCACLCSEIDEARQCLIAGAQRATIDHHCQPFDSQQQGTELAIEHLCTTARQRTSLSVPYVMILCLGYGNRTSYSLL